MSLIKFEDENRATNYDQYFLRYHTLEMQS